MKNFNYLLTMTMNCKTLLLTLALLPQLGMSEPPPQPKEPVLSHTPERAEWSVQFSPAGDDSPGKSKVPGDLASVVPEGKPREVKSIDFSKDSRMRTYRLRTRWSDGGSDVSWVIAGVSIAGRTNQKGFYIVPVGASASADLASSDFPELEWLNLSYFRETKSINGRNVFVFTIPFDKKPLSRDEARRMELAKQENPRFKPSDVFQPKVSEVVVHLDAVTQLPVLYNDGLTIRKYVYSPTPDTPLRPTKDVLDFMRARNDMLIKKLRTPPPP